MYWILLLFVVIVGICFCYQNQHSDERPGVEETDDLLIFNNEYRWSKHTGGLYKYNPLTREYRKVQTISESQADMSNLIKGRILSDDGKTEMALE